VQLGQFVRVQRIIGEIAGERSQQLPNAQTVKNSLVASGAPE